MCASCCTLFAARKYLACKRTQIKRIFATTDGVLVLQARRLLLTSLSTVSIMVVCKCAYICMLVYVCVCARARASACLPFLSSSLLVAFHTSRTANESFFVSVPSAFAKMIPPGDPPAMFEEKVIQHVRDASKRRMVRFSVFVCVRVMCACARSPRVRAYVWLCWCVLCGVSSLLFAFLSFAV
jgi:hypothetical protein